MENKLAALVLALCGIDALAHTITGTVIGPDGPVSGVKIEFRYESDPSKPGYTTTSDGEGKFSGPAPNEILFLTAIPPESRRLEVFQDGIGQVITRDSTVRIRLRRIVRISGEIRNAAGQRTAGTVELYSLTNGAQHGQHSRANPVLSVETSTGSFSVEGPGDFYALHARATGRTLPSARLNVDARTSTSGLQLVLGDSEGRLMPKRAPRADRITIGAPDGDYGFIIAGAAGATEAFSSLRAVNMMTGQTVAGVSAADGSFSLRAYGAPGASIALYQDPTGWYIPVAPNNAAGVPALFLPVPGVNGDIATASSLFGGVLEQSTALTIETFGALDDGQWILSGALTDRQWEPGESVSLGGKLLILSRNLGTDVSAVSVSGGMSLALRFDAAGRQRVADKSFHSTTLTPTGFPIERRTSDPLLAGLQITNLRSIGPGRAEADWSATFTVPSQMPPSIAQPHFQLDIQGIPNDGRFLDAPVSIGGTAFRANAVWPLITIGNPAPPRLFFAFGLNDFDNGARGTIAMEDRGAYQLANHVTVASDTFVIPRRDERTGLPIRHRLEPFVPLLTGFDSFRCASPLFFAFPSGSLRVKVHRPDGTVDDLGEAPFRQLESRFALTRSDLRIALGTAGMPAPFELTTLDPRFEYEFAQQGKHVIEMTGSISDIWGRTYEGGGRYEVIVGRTLDIDGGVIPGTPFPDGGTFAATVTLTPPVPADVELRILHLPQSDPSRAQESVVRTRANRFGHVAVNGIRLDGAGEFRVDVHAMHVDEHGTVRAGSVRWGSVVESGIESGGGSIVTHGRRGFQDAPHVGQQWLRFTDDGQQPGDHVMYPFHGGDVMWMEDTDRFSGLADSPAISLQDNAGALAARARARFQRFPAALGSAVPYHEREAAGEIPLFSSGEAARHDWGDPDQWGYAYMYAERPSIRVREMVSEDYTPAAYWRFRDEYHFQPGVGIEGDRPNDFKFQFGGAVWRDDADGFRFYGAYASLFVLIPERDPEGGRIMPPFRGNGGGPDGGPLFTLKGKEVDLFFHPTGVRPGTILHRGERASFAGYSAPTLPSKIEIVVTSPSGRTRRIAGQANEVGYFYEPAKDFSVGEPGVWKAKVKIVFDGRTSAGQVSAPFPAGDVLGSREGEFYFYVVDNDTPPLELAPMPQFVRPADGPVTFTVEPPPGLTNLQLTRTTTMPGFILEEATTASMTYRYDATKLARDFPNLDLHDADAYAGADTITVSFLLTGDDAGGAKRHFARQVILQGEEVQMPAQSARPKRRSMR